MRFDLREVSSHLVPFTVRRKRIAILGVIFLGGFGGFFAATSIPRILSGQFPSGDFFGFGIILVMVGGGIAMLTPILTGPTVGASELVIGESGFELRYPSGKSTSVVWSDPELHFELADCSQVKPGKLLSGQPYSMTLNGVRSLLSPEAFSEVLRQATDQGLLVTTGQGSQWIYSADANPIIHQVRSPRTLTTVNGANRSGPLEQPR